MSTNNPSQVAEAQATADEKTCRNCGCWEAGRKSGHGTCNAIGMATEDDRLGKANMVWRAADDWDLSINLVTAADFGCTLWDG